jgi:molybdopterin-binding protein
MGIISKNMGHTSVAIATDMRTHLRSSITKESANKLDIRSSGGQEQPVKEIKL